MARDRFWGSFNFAGLLTSGRTTFRMTRGEVIAEESSFRFKQAGDGSAPTRAKPKTPPRLPQGVQRRRHTCMEGSAASSNTVRLKSLQPFESMTKLKVPPIYPR